MLPGIPLVLIRDVEVLRQHEGCLSASDTVEPGNKVNHVLGGSSAEAVKAAVNLHAWVFVVVERADTHLVPVHFNCITLRSLPCGDELLYGFKYIQWALLPDNPNVSDIMSLTLPINSVQKKKALVCGFKSQNKCLFKVPYSIVSVSGSAGFLLPVPAECVPAALSGSRERTVSSPDRRSGGIARMAIPD